MLDLAIDSRVFLYDELDCAVQELDMIFNTENTELIGDVDYGTNFEQFLFQLTPSITQLRKYIYEKMSESYFLKRYDVDIDIEILEGNLRKIYDVVITIKDPESEKKINRIYQFK